MKTKSIRFLIFTLICTLLLCPLGACTKQPNLKPLKNQAAVPDEGNGFVLLQKKAIPKQNLTTYTFKHKKTGAKLIYLENDDPQKVFTIAFRTPPENDKGCPHVVEHGMFAGSQKYGVKDILSIAEKKGFSTFMNAFTAKDHTYYPIASTNQKAFKNLMTLYLDSLFNPSILKNKYVFMREAFRYQITSPNGPLQPNGVVYNEMRGNAPTKGYRFVSTLYDSLFPNSPYRYESGGNPNAILDLTYEEFRDFYKKYYHPSNAYIYLYGKMDLDSTLKWLDEKYLSAFSAKKMNTKIPLQPTFKEPKRVESTFHIPKGESPDGKRVVSLNYVVGKIDNKKLQIATSVLASYLNNPGSELHSALKKANFSGTLSVEHAVESLQPFTVIELDNTNLSKSDSKPFETLVNNVFKNLYKNGLNKDILESTLNGLSISNKDITQDASRGLNYNSQILKGWLYDLNPNLYLEIDPTIESLKKDPSYFQNIINQYFLNNTHKSVVLMEPVAGLIEQENNKLEQKLNNTFKSLSKEQVQTLIKDYKGFQKWQNTPDDPNALDDVFTFTLKDLDTTLPKYSSSTSTFKDAKILHTKAATDNISYINLYFDTKRIPENQLMYLQLLPRLLGRVNTKSYTSGQILNTVNSLGNLSFSNEIYRQYKSNAYDPKMVVRIKSLAKDSKTMLDLVQELITQTDFSNTQQIKAIVNELKGSFSFSPKQNIGLVASRLKSYFGPSYRYEELGNYAFYEFLNELSTTIKENPKQVQSNLEKVAQLAFPKQNLFIGITGQDKEFQISKPFIENFISLQKDVTSPIQKYNLTAPKTNEGISIPATVQFIAKGTNLKSLGYDLSAGKNAVLSTIVSRYVNNEVRFKGGAYGGQFVIDQYSNMMALCWQAPDINNVMNAYNNIPKAIQNFKASDKDMKEYILATIKSLYTPLSVYSQGIRNEEFALTNYSYKDLENIIKDALSTKASDIKKYAPILQKGMNQSSYCILGNSAKIQAYMKTSK